MKRHNFATTKVYTRSKHNFGASWWRNSIWCLSPMCVRERGEEHKKGDLQGKFFHVRIKMKSVKNIHVSLHQ